MIEQSAVAILDGDRVIGQALEILLQDTRYKSKFLPSLSLDELKQMLADVGLVIVPGDYDSREEGFVSNLISLSTSLGIPVLKLVAVVEENEEDLVRMVSWPCPIESLKKEIEAALLASPNPGYGD